MDVRNPSISGCIAAAEPCIVLRTQVDVNISLMDGHLSTSAIADQDNPTSINFTGWCCTWMLIDPKIAANVTVALLSQRVDLVPIQQRC